MTAGSMTGHALFTGVDRALVVSTFGQRLRRAGLTVPLNALERATAAMEAVGPTTRDDLYWLCRLSFVGDRSQLPVFDQVFERVFDSESLRNEQRSIIRGADQASRGGDHEQRTSIVVDGAAVAGSGLPWTARPTVVADTYDEDDDPEGRDDVQLPVPTAASDAGLGDRAFDELDEDELASLGTRLEALVDTWPRRRVRRRRLAAGGTWTELRWAMRKALATGGEPIELPTSKPRVRPRRVVLLIDVSGSMEPYARAYLHLGRALAASSERFGAEVFAFATDATRITSSLRLRSPVEAIERASAEVGDRFGGTRLATSLATILRHPWWSSTVRAAVVIVVSDGWDTDSPASLDNQMARLGRTAHRVIWVNPRIAADDFEPTVSGMATALPYCDRFLSGHSLSAMGDVLGAISD